MKITTVNNIDSMEFNDKLQGVEDSAFKQAVDEHRKKQRDFEAATDNSEADKVVDNKESDRDRKIKINQMGFSKMHLDESLFEEYDVDDDGFDVWQDDVHTQRLAYRLVSRARKDGKLLQSRDAYEIIDQTGGDDIEQIYRNLIWDDLTRDELIAKEGTDNVDLINAGREPHRRVRIKEDLPAAQTGMAPVDTTPPAPETPEDNGIANMLNILIRGEWETIEDYNDVLLTLSEMNAGEDLVDILKDIVNEEHIHVGQLQKALEQVSPNTVSIAHGEAEAEGQIKMADADIDAGKTPIA